MSGFPDTGPGEDGRRSVEQWKNAMAEDMSLVRMYVDETLNHDLPREEIALKIACARKEAGRLESDLRRFGEEVHGLTREDFDNVGHL